MTLYKAIKILLKLGEKETIVLGFKDWHGYTASNTIRYLGEEAEKWYNHSISVLRYDEVEGMRSVNKSNAYNFISKYLEQGKQIWVKQSTCDLYNV